MTIRYNGFFFLIDEITNNKQKRGGGEKNKQESPIADQVIHNLTSFVCRIYVHFFFYKTGLSEEKRKAEQI